MLALIQPESERKVIKMAADYQKRLLTFIRPSTAVIIQRKHLIESCNLLYVHGVVSPQECALLLNRLRVETYAIR